VTVSPGRLVFAGTPEFAATILRALLEGPHRIVAVYTQSDRPAGRGRRPRPCAVKVVAQSHGLRVHQPVTLKGPEAAQELAELNADLMIVVAYGLLLPSSILKLPRLGCLNVHASLLPRWRGAAPIQRAILAGDSESGITLIKMDPGLDTGPVVSQTSCAIDPQDTAQTLHDRLARLGAECLTASLDAILTGRIQSSPQDERLATYAPKIERAEARLDWNKSAIELERKIRAFNPKPVAFTELRGVEMRVWEGRALADHTEQPPGSIVSSKDGYLDVAAGQGILRLLRIQLPGRRPVTAADFLNAHPEFARNAWDGVPGV
jgi:methionyl-tRNA formyltransferase